MEGAKMFEERENEKKITVINESMEEFWIKNKAERTLNIQCSTG